MGDAFFLWCRRSLTPFAPLAQFRILTDGVVGFKTLELLPEKDESGGASMRVLTLIGLSASFALPLAIAAQNAAGCNPVGNVQFVCGQVSPEDLAVVPGSEWVLASGDAANGAIRLISVRGGDTTGPFSAWWATEGGDDNTFELWCC